MKLIKWIPYKLTDYNSKEYIDPSEKILELVNPNKKLFIRKDDDFVKDYAEKNDIGINEAFEFLKKENEKIPYYIDEDKANFYKDINEMCYIQLKKYCIENNIFITDTDHQSRGCEGIPVFKDDDGQKYMMFYSLRAWSGLMAEVWNAILKTDKYYYLDFYCGMRNKEIDEYLKALKI